MGKNRVTSFFVGFQELFHALYADYPTSR